MNRLVSTGALAIGLLLAGCTTPPPGDDGADAGDALGPGQTRLSVAFLSQRPIPGSAGGTWDATISSAYLDLSELRATGDSGVAHRASASLDWSSELAPAPLALEDAQPGIYSLFAASIEGYGVRGTVVVAGQPRDFEVADVPRPALSLANELRLELSAGDDAVHDVEVDFRKLIDAVSWNDIAPDVDGVLRVDQDVAQIDSVRDELEDMFEDDD